MPRKVCMLSVSPAVHIPPGLHPSVHLHLSGTPSPSHPYLGYDFVTFCFMLEASPPLTLSLSLSRPLSLSLLGVRRFPGCRWGSMLFFRSDLVSLMHLQAGVDTDWPRFRCGNAGVGRNRNGIVHHGCSRHWQAL
ncbi:hypothetical protein ARMGADRAFT_1009414 [Armillaria gallica]|uniref:Uncharacterized protein n=1 Tax=Armillaria gallica TaxID=47427 RepID=A0A2H3E112_ARMGA|nr:hypothetical protein ARMGADRAFT_1009414 [Armillaria gallica]